MAAAHPTGQLTAIGHARVRVLAVGVGLTDLMARRGDYLLQRKLPFTPGYEFVGEVVNHEELEPGTLVAAALPRMGAYAEYVVLPSWLLVPVCGYASGRSDSHLTLAAMVCAHTTGPPSTAGRCRSLLLPA
jgi:NADPH:quinone reductase-like Zn-dependent oxidoreductase